MQEDPAARAVCADRKDSSHIALAKAVHFIRMVQSQSEPLPALSLIKSMVAESLEQRAEIDVVLQHECMHVLSSGCPTGLGGQSMQEHQTLPQQGQTSADGANASPKDQKGTPLPGIIELAAAAAPVLNHLAPGYYTTFLQAVLKLGKHMDSILLQYILASLQYPTVVQKNVDTFAALPAKSLRLV